LRNTFAISAVKKRLLRQPLDPQMDDPDVAAAFDRVLKFLDAYMKP
jgi:hypothetical protein